MRSALFFLLFATGYTLAWAPALPPELEHLTWTQERRQEEFIKYFIRRHRGVAFDLSWMAGANPGATTMCVNGLARSIPKISRATGVHFLELMAWPWTESRFNCGAVRKQDTAYGDSVSAFQINMANQENTRCDVGYRYWDMDFYWPCVVEVIHNIHKSGKYQEALARRAMLPTSFVLGGNPPPYRGGDQSGPAWAHYVRKKAAVAVLARAYKEWWATFQTYA